MINVKLWIFLGILVFGIGWLAFHKYNTTLVDNGKLITQNETLSDNVAYGEWSQAITDKVVKEFVEEKIQTNTTTAQVRKEAIDEYFKEDDKKVIHSESNKPQTDNGESARVAKLANSMLVYYCTARPKDVRCNPVSPTDPVSH